MIVFVVVTIVQNGEATYCASRFVHRTASLVSKEKFSVGMFIEREPLSVKSDALVHLQGRHPLRNFPIDGKRQREEILRLPFVVEIDACDVHK